MRRTVGGLMVRALRYRVVGQPPPDPTFVIVAAPHTSWLDFPLMLGMAWSQGIDPGWLGKKELFRAPFGGAMRALGGVPVDRDDPGTLVADLVARASSGTPFALVIAPEGTRGKASGWKSGFYRIAQDAGVPLVLTFVDGPTRTGGFGPSLVPSGDVHADMELVRAFYADKHGVKPERASVPRLAAEQVAEH
ncbi:MAG: 1-acyl-sn-glycerol-3-phosphate acyltransferase [Candidatus Nanopelagicales bacterium]